MTDAYRDDLEAARARVSDLEREAERLRKRNAELTARNREPAEPQAEPVAAPAPTPSAIVRTMVGLTQVCVGMAIFALGGRKFHHDPAPEPHFGWAAICIVLAFVFWCCSGFHPLWRSRR